MSQDNDFHSWSPSFLRAKKSTIDDEYIGNVINDSYRHEILIKISDAKEEALETIAEASHDYKEILNVFDNSCAAFLHVLNTYIPALEQNLGPTSSGNT